MLDVLEQRGGRLARSLHANADLGRPVVGHRAERLDDPVRARTDQLDRPSGDLVETLGQAGTDLGPDGVAQLAPSVFEVVDDLAFGKNPADGAGQGGAPSGCERRPGCLRDDVFELVGLVDDHDVVVGENPLGRHVQGVQVEVDDDDVGRRGPMPRQLGEAILAMRASGCARALVTADADHAPRLVGDVGYEIGPIAGVGRRCESTKTGDRRGVEWIVGDLQLEPIVSVDLVEPLPAQVVRSALQHGELQFRTELLLEKGQILLRQLILESLRCRGDDRSAAAERDGDQIGQRLAGAGSGLDDQVPLLLEDVGHCRGHRSLSLASLSAAGQGGRHGIEGIEGALSQSQRVSTVRVSDERTVQLPPRRRPLPTASAPDPDGRFQS